MPREPRFGILRMLSTSVGGGEITNTESMLTTAMSSQSAVGTGGTVTEAWAESSPQPLANVAVRPVI